MKKIFRPRLRSGVINMCNHLKSFLSYNHLKGIKHFILLLNRTLKSACHAYDMMGIISSCSYLLALARDLSLHH